MFEDKNKMEQKTPLEKLGEFGLIKHLTEKFKLNQATSIFGVGDDAAVFKHNEEKVSVITTDMLVEGIHFNIRYTPLKYLGYKSAVVNFSDVFAMNAYPQQMVIAIAVSNKYTVEALEELYEGIILACEKYNVDLVGGDTTSSPQGLVISITVVGQVNEKDICYRSGAKPNDLICVSGDLGGAYAGLLVLQREEKTFLANPYHQPELEPYSYVIERQLKPEARKDIIEKLRKHNIKPNAMIDISDGLSSELLHLCTQSQLGCKVFENKLPIDYQTCMIAEEFRMVPATLALNGGEDYELLFSVDIAYYDIIKTIPEISIIGHMVTDPNIRYFITNAGQAVDLKAQGWKAF